MFYIRSCTVHEYQYCHIIVNLVNFCNIVNKHGNPALIIDSGQIQNIELKDNFKCLLFKHKRVRVKDCGINSIKLIIGNEN